MINSRDKKERRASFVIDGSVVETVYDPVKNSTAFVICKKNKIGTENYIKIKGNPYYPLDPNSDIIRKNIVLLPSAPAEYKTEEELIDVVGNFIHKYLDISQTFESLAIYYVLFSWLYDKFHEVAYLRAIGDFGSGKSRFLQVIGSICYRPIFTGGATTTAPIFRILDQIRGTLVLDEADMRQSDMASDITKILNMGYQKGGSVLRMKSKESDEIKAFDVYSPKIIATRETFADMALESRCLTEDMGKGKLRDDIPLSLTDKFWNEARDIRNMLLVWRCKNFNKNIDIQNKQTFGIHPRLNQIIAPILSVIKSDQVRNSIIDFIKIYNQELLEMRGTSMEASIISAILRLSKNNPAELLIKNITSDLNQNSDIEDDVIKPRKVGWYLRSKMQMKTHRTRTGYMLSLKRNAEKINYWKDRLGLTDTDNQKSEDVNIVNFAGIKTD